jgi:DNA-binding MarR family transcriptional regulator
MTVARLVDRLEELGLVKRCADSEDRRMWRLRLTPAAVPLVRHIKTLRANSSLLGQKGSMPALLATHDVGRCDALGDERGSASKTKSCYEVDKASQRKHICA